MGEWLYGTEGESDVCVENKMRDFLQCVDVLVPFRALRNAPHRSRPPDSLPVGHGSKESSLFPKERAEMGEVARSEDWRENKT
jgi:hypothetical protein